MCGLVGVAGLLGLKDEATIKRLLLFDYLRGADATGLASIRDNGEIKIAKLATDPITFFDFPAFKQTLNGHQSRVFIGHNRAATRGEKTHFNAHPFHYGNIVGAHNGTLDQQSWNRLEDKLGESFNVDSQALICAIDRLGIKEAIGLCTNGKDYQTGAWSLVWYNQVEGSLNFLRNEHRPMWYSYAEDFKELYWASEWWMIEAAAQAGGHKLYKNENGASFFPTEVDRHYKFDVGLIITGQSLPKPKTKIIKGREPAKVTNIVTDPFGRTGTCGFGVPTKGSNSKKTGNSGTTSRSQADSVIHWLGSPKQPFAGLISEEKFNQLAKYGCSWCSGEVEYGDPGVLIIERDDILLCSGPNCAGSRKAANEDNPATRLYLPGPKFNELRD